MAVKPHDLVRYAESLARQSRFPDAPETLKELLARSSVSRGYYGVYHFALNWARKRGFYAKPKGWGTHEALWETWYRSDPITEEIADLGSELRVRRNRADYDIRNQRVDDAVSIIQAVSDLWILIEEDIARCGGSAADVRP